MSPEELHLVLDAVRSGAVSVDSAAERIHRENGYVSGEVARVDIGRLRRRGLPEVIYCEHKTAEEIERIARVMLDAHGLAFGTRCGADVAEHVLAAMGSGEYDPVGRTLRFGSPLPARTTEVTAVVAAGTSDRPVCEELCTTLETFGAPVDRIYDVGVAGIHRLFSQIERIERASVVIVVAGMEGALPSVVGGLCRQPVIAVPTSVGYGAAFSGVAALLGMLNSCAGGITVVNIDNGFGAALAALSIIDAIERGRGTNA